jgi:O-antigen/teichoic acid export membrane protein
MSHDKQGFVKNSIFTITRQFTNILVGILLLVVLARVLGPEGQGMYTTITLFPTILLTFLTLGINTSTVYYVSKGEVELDTVYNNNIIIGIVLSILSIVMGFLTIYFFSEKFFPNIPDGLLYLCLLALPFLFLREYFQTIFQGLQDFKTFNTIMVVNQLGILGAVFVIVFALDLGIYGAISSFILGNLITVLFMLLILFKRNVRYKRGSFSREYFRKSVKYGLKSHVSNFASFLNYRIVILMITAYLNPAAVGIFGVAMNVSERMSIFAVSFSSVLYPKIASVNTEEQRNRITSLVSRNVFAITILVSIAAFFLADFVIVSFFGQEYEKSALLLKILIPGLALLSVEKILSNDIAGRGRPEINMYLSIFNVLFNVLLNFLLIPRYELIGAASATTITYFVSFLVKIIIFHKVTGEPFHRFIVWKKNDLLLYKDIIRKLKPNRS